MCNALCANPSYVQMAYRDLGDFYHATGDLSAAYKNHTKCREFCTTSQQVLDVSLTVLAVRVSFDPVVCQHL
jgi:COP9 signalosome complex subunit 1